MTGLILPIFVLFSILGLLVGVLLMINPALAIELQRRFYAQINWKIEPVSMPKEIRNTRLMGWFLIILLTATLASILTNKLILP